MHEELYSQLHQAVLAKDTAGNRRPTTRRCVRPARIPVAQIAVEAAFYSFQDRYRALPGDYAAASANLDCGALACLNGNGSGRIEPGTAGQLHEDILAWHHLTASGLLGGEYRMFNSNVASPAFDNTPTNAFGGYLQPRRPRRGISQAEKAIAARPHCFTELDRRCDGRRDELLLHLTFVHLLP
jgi:hypothetical protein